MAKVCPQCRTTHPDALEYCPRDGAALQAVESRRFPSTMMGSSGLAEALLAEEKSGPRTAPAAAARGGHTLAELLTKGPLPTDLATSRVAELADVLAADRNAVHGALTPRHVCYPAADFTGRPTVLAPDAVEMDALEAAAYRAPELTQASTSGTDVAPPTLAADIYALGCILFECLTGRPPFKGKTVAEVQKRHATAAAPAVRQVRLDCELPPSLEIEIQRTLKKRPGDRHASLQHLSQALRAAVRDDDRTTMALGSGEAAFLQQLLQQQGPEADSGMTPRSFAAARAVRVSSALHSAMPLGQPFAQAPALSQPAAMTPASRIPPAPQDRPTPAPSASEAPALTGAEVPASTGSKVGLLIGAAAVVLAVAALATWQVIQIAPKPAVVAATAPVVEAVKVVPPEAPPAALAPVPVAVQADVMAEPADVQIAAEEPDAGSTVPTAAKSEHKARKGPASQGRTSPATTENKKATHDGPITF